MSQKEIEVILTRHLASYLTMPIFIVEPSGTLIYFNESAESILGCRFDDTGEMPLSEWSTKFEPTTEDGTPFPAEQLPLALALSKRRPHQGQLWICGLDNVRRHIEIMALPLVGQGERYMGAVAIFWELREEDGSHTLGRTGISSDSGR